MTLADRIAAARGDAPASLILRNAALVNVLSGEIHQTDIVVKGDTVVALGPGYRGEREIDLNGRYVCPGFIDAHVHIESSLCTPPEYSRAVLAHGVTSVVTDPHEIANVLGIDGIHFMLERAKNGPINVFVMASSCVPATAMETSGATLEADDLKPLLDNDWVLGLAEMMNYPGVIYSDEGVLDKLDLFGSRVLDGHAPAVTGKLLQAYVAAGISSDHECTTLEEAQEKLRLGLTIFAREGTTSHNLRSLLPLVTPMNHTRICFCSDDRHPDSLINQGSINYMVKTAISEGIDPVMAIRMGTINTANHFRLYRHGAIAPGRIADMVVFSDLNDLRAEMVFRGGTLAAENGVVLGEKPPLRPIKIKPSMNVRLDDVDFTIPATGSQVRVIVHEPNQVRTGHDVADATIVDGQAVTDVERDILKIVVLERHHGTGNTGKGFIRGFGLKHGALAGTVAHDHHNLIVVGVDDRSMRRAVEAVHAMGGGLAVVDGDTVLAQLALPVGGLMSEEPIETVKAQYDALIRATHNLGSPLHDPLMVLGFMALEVIPKLKLTDVGLVDVEQFKVVDLFV